MGGNNVYYNIYAGHYVNQLLDFNREIFLELTCLTSPSLPLVSFLNIVRPEKLFPVESIYVKNPHIRTYILSF